MPCNSDHMEPTVKERQVNEAAQHLVYAYRALGKVVPKRIVDAAVSPYGGSEGESMMVELCDLIRGMNDVQQAQIVYNGRVREARRLADWWEEHQAEDERRIEAERAKHRTAKGAHKFFRDASNRSAPPSISAMVDEYAKISGLEADPDHGDGVYVFHLEDGVAIISYGAGFEVWQGRKMR